MAEPADVAQAGGTKPLDDVQAISDAVTQLRKDARELLADASRMDQVPASLALQSLSLIRGALAAQARKLDDRIRRLPGDTGANGHIREVQTRVDEAAEYLDIVSSLLMQAPRAPSLCVVADAAGLDLRPDPLLARTGPELMRILREYWVWAGEPSFRRLSERNGGTPATTTLWKALKGDAMPRLDVLLAIVTGCGGGDQDLQRFASAWRAIRGGRINRDQNELAPD